MSFPWNDPAPKEQLPTIASRFIHPESQDMRVKGSTKSWNPISHDLGQHDESALISPSRRAPNQALAVGTQVIPGQSVAFGEVPYGGEGYGGDVPGYSGLDTTASDLKPYDASAIPSRAPNTALSMGTQVMDGQSVGASYAACETTAQDLKPYDASAVITPQRRARNDALALGTQVMDGQSVGASYAACETTAQDLKPYDASAIPKRAPNRVVCVGTSVLPYEGYFDVAEPSQPQSQRT